MKCPACRQRLTRFDRQRGLSIHLVCPTGEPDQNCCGRCGEPLTHVTLGSIKCACLAPRMPSHLRNNDKDDRPSPAIRYGN